MKNTLIVLGMIALFVAMILAAVSGYRYFSSVTTRVDVVHPKPGIECVLASTGGGTALSCNWQVK